MPIALSEPNSKLGSVWNWSIPAVTTCPGATEACLTSCYARRGNYVFPKSKNFFQNNLEGSRGEDFVETMVGLIRGKDCRTFRIHGAGDFYDAGYIKKWIQIAAKLKDVRFYFYTRSWRIAALKPALRSLTKLKNVYAWFSADRTSGRPPKWKNVRIAYMSASDAESETIPYKPDLIFRSCRRKTVKKKIQGVPVCPAENGQEKKVTCGECRLCWRGFSVSQPQEKK